MDDDGIIDNEPTDVDTEATQDEETELLEEAEAPGQAEGEDLEGDESPPEEIEFDFGGNKLRVVKDSIPDEVAGEVDRFSKNIWSDYTKKSQAVADQRKSLEAREQAVQKFQGLQGEALETYSKGLTLRGEIEQLQGIDVNELWQSNPDQARRLSDTISSKQAQFNKVVNRVSELENGMGQAQAEGNSKAMAEGKAVMERRIKGFQDKVPEIAEYVSKSYGIDQASIDQWAMNPAGAEMAYKAMLYDKMKSKARKGQKVQPRVANPVKPIVGKGGSRTTKDPDKMSADEWQKWRNAQIKKKTG